MRLERRLERVKGKPDLGCPSARFDICGRLIVERERYARLEEELQRTRRHVDRYRQYFSILLKSVGSSLRRNTIPEIFKYEASRISQVEAIYCFQKRNIVSLWIFLEEENWAAEDRIYEIYGMLLSVFPEYDIRLRLLRLWGREPDDLLPVGGTKLFGK